jgi:hypothetical protein
VIAAWESLRKWKACGHRVSRVSTSHALQWSTPWSGLPFQRIHFKHDAEEVSNLAQFPGRIVKQPRAGRHRRHKLSCVARSDSDKSAVLRTEAIAIRTRGHAATPVFSPSGRDLRPGTRRRPFRAALSVVGLGFMAYCNWRVAGNALQMPYQLHRTIYGMPQSFYWQDPSRGHLQVAAHPTRRCTRSEEAPGRAGDPRARAARRGNTWYSCGTSTRMNSTTSWSTTGPRSTNSRWCGRATWGRRITRNS